MAALRVPIQDIEVQFVAQGKNAADDALVGMLNDVRLGDKTIFDCMDFLASNILMPAVGAGVALFTAWISWPRLANELAGPGQRPLWLHGMWLLCGLVAPVAIGIIWINGL